MKNQKVWILLSAANDYNQPEAAFENIWWEKPTYEDLKHYGFTEEDADQLFKPNRGGETEYWVSEFTKTLKRGEKK